MTPRGRWTLTVVLATGGALALGVAPGSAGQSPVGLDLRFEQNGEASGGGTLFFQNSPRPATQGLADLLGAFTFSGNVDGGLNGGVADDVRAGGELFLAGPDGNPVSIGAGDRLRALDGRLGTPAGNDVLLGGGIEGGADFTAFPGAGQRAQQLIGPAALAGFARTPLSPQLIDSVPPNGPKAFRKNALRFSHFKCYRVVRRVGGFRARTVDLADQFSDYSRVRVTRPVEVCNPVAKRHLGRTFRITDSRRHLVVFAVAPRSAPRLDLTTRNQFFTQRVRNGGLNRLLVPSRKRQSLGPRNAVGRTSSSRVLDHLACYPARVDAGAIGGGRVGLIDQFERKRHRLASQSGICNPAVMRHRGTRTPVRFPDSHLISIRLRDVASPARAMTVRNRFGVQRLVTGNPTRLLVPSTMRVCATWDARVDVPVTTLARQQLDTLRTVSLTPYEGEQRGACPTVLD